MLRYYPEICIKQALNPQQTSTITTSACLPPSNNFNDNNSSKPSYNLFSPPPAQDEVQAHYEGLSHPTLHPYEILLAVCQVMLQTLTRIDQQLPFCFPEAHKNDTAGSLEERSRCESAGKCQSDAHLYSEHLEAIVGVVWEDLSRIISRDQKAEMVALWFNLVVMEWMLEDCADGGGLCDLVTDGRHVVIL
jgi:hypothetical protein